MLNQINKKSFLIEQFNVIMFYVALSSGILCYLILYNLMLYHALLCYLILSCPIQCYSYQCYIKLCGAIWFYLVRIFPSRIFSSSISWYLLLFYVFLLSYATSYYLPYHTISCNCLLYLAASSYLFQFITIMNFLGGHI